MFSTILSKYWGDKFESTDFVLVSGEGRERETETLQCRAEWSYHTLSYEVTSCQEEVGQPSRACWRKKTRVETRTEPSECIFWHPEGLTSLFRQKFNYRTEKERKKKLNKEAWLAQWNLNLLCSVFRLWATEGIVVGTVGTMKQTTNAQSQQGSAQDTERNSVWLERDQFLLC